MTDESSIDPKLLQVALQHQQAGRLSEATKIYSQILAVEPTNIDALHLSGVIAYQSGQFKTAEILLRRALIVNDEVANIHNSLGLALTDQKKFDAAIKCFERAISLAPESTQAYNNLGNLLQDCGRFNDAIVVYRRAIELDPQHAMAHFNLGNTLRRSDDLADAENHYRESLRLAPSFEETARALGQLLIGRRQTAEAERVLRDALSRTPDSVGLICELGGCLLAREEPELAIPVFHQAIEKAPRLGQAWFGLGCAQLETGDFVNAIHSFRQTAGIDPDHMETRQNLGRCYFEMGLVDEAVAEFRAAITPSALCPAIATLAAIMPSASAADNQQIVEARKTFGYHAARMSAPVKLNNRPGNERITVGYLTSFDNESCMKRFTGLLRYHNRDKLQVHWFCDGKAGALSSRVDVRDTVYDTSQLTNEEFIENIVSAEINILVDLNGYRSSRRLAALAAKPAPIIIGLNNIATTGLSAFNYLVTDDHLVNDNEDRFYGERLLRAPGTCLTFRVDYPVPDIVAPPCLEGGGITFGCLGSQFKISSAVIRTWSEILKQCPECQLLLRNGKLDLKSNRAFVRNSFRNHGVDPDRIQLTGPADHFQFLQTYNHIDIALDTFPHNGCSTTIEALWQGVPVLTWYGDRWASRLSASMMRSAFLAEFVAKNRAEYIDRAVAMAFNREMPARLEVIRSGMRSRIELSPVGNARRLTTFLEGEYRRIINDRWRESV